MLNPALTISRSKVSNSVFTREASASMSVNDRVARNHNGVLAKLFLRRFQAGLRATRHQNARTTIEEHFRRSEPHAARAADNHHPFRFPLHAYSPCASGVALLILNCLVL